MPSYKVRGPCTTEELHFFRFFLKFLLKRQKYRDLPSVSSLPKWPRWPSLKPEAKSSHRVSHRGTGAQEPKSSFATIPGRQQGAWIGSRAARTRTYTLMNASATSCSLGYCTTVPAPTLIFSLPLKLGAQGEGILVGPSPQSSCGLTLCRSPNSPWLDVGIFTSTVVPKWSAFS